MPTISYLCGKTWGEITREERVFCAILFSKASADPAAFAKAVSDRARLALKPDEYWELGYEVCFYRDLLCVRGEKIRGDYSPKRTFDLCLFSENAMIVIEAKAHQNFQTKQALSVAEDRRQIQRLVGREIDVRMVALASSTDLTDQIWQNRSVSLKPFDGYLTWAIINEFACDVITP